MAKSDSVAKGPRFDEQTRARLQGLDHAHAAAPTWRGWAIGLLACAALCVIVPHVDYIIRHTRLALNLLPASSLVLGFILVLGFNFGLARVRKSLALTRQDLALVFAMTMLVNPIPTNGFLSYYVTQQMGSFYYARAENKWDTLIHPHIPEKLAPRDPEDGHSAEPRPVEWFYSGLPEGKDVPWDILIGPYIRWCIALTFILGAFFCLSALLHRQWSDRERLPFPLAEVPDIMFSGLGKSSARTAFLKSGLAWAGIVTTLLLHSWNALGDYTHVVAPIQLMNGHIDGTYLTEGALRHLHPVYVNIYPSVIGIMYLISTEVSFSLWFFYIIVLKACILIAVLVFGLGWNGWYFGGQDGEQAIFTAQGTGAAFAMVFVGFFLARGLLWGSIKQAVGLEPVERGEEEMHPRTIWGVLLICLAGSVGWMVWSGISWHWACIAIIILMLSSVAIARLVSEGGVFFLQMGGNPVELMTTVITPVTLGSQNFVMLSIWSRVFVFDWYRSNPLINIIGAMHLGSLTHMKRRSLILGLIAALIVTFALSFYTFHRTIYTAPGGAQTLGWAFTNYPQSEFNRIGTKVNKIEAFQTKQKEYAAQGKDIPAQEIPNVAQADYVKLRWFVIGMVVMVIFMFMRTRVFWWPHPIGYVMWMAMWPIHRMWFSYFLGWAVKTLIVKFGGQRTYLGWRNYFIGLVVGEALATTIWLIVAFLSDHSDGYGMHYN